MIEACGFCKRLAVPHPCDRPAVDQDDHRVGLRRSDGLQQLLLRTHCSESWQPVGGGIRASDARREEFDRMDDRQKRLLVNSVSSMKKVSRVGYSIESRIETVSPRSIANCFKLARLAVVLA